MRARIGMILLSLVMVAGGCFKKREIKVEKRPATGKTKKMARADRGFPQDLTKEEFVFDDNAPEMADFAFIDEDPNDDGVPGGVTEAEQLALAEDGSADPAAGDVVTWQEDEEEFAALRFDFDSAKLIEGQKDTLKKNIECAKKAAAKGDKVVLDTYACEIGEEAYNLALTQRRANALKKRFVEAGVPEEAIEPVGRGQTCPIAQSDATERLARIKELSPNRRAEISTVGAEAAA